MRPLAYVLIAAAGVAFNGCGASNGSPSQPQTPVASATPPPSGFDRSTWTDLDRDLRVWLNTIDKARESCGKRLDPQSPLSLDQVLGCTQASLGTSVRRGDRFINDIERRAEGLAPGPCSDAIAEVVAVGTDFQEATQRRIDTQPRDLSDLQEQTEVTAAWWAARRDLATTSKRFSRCASR